MPSKAASIAMVGAGTYASSAAFSAISAPVPQLQTPVEGVQVNKQQHLRGLGYDSMSAEGSLSFGSSARVGVGAVAASAAVAAVVAGNGRSRTVRGSLVVKRARAASPEAETQSKAEAVKKPVPNEEISTTQAPTEIETLERAFAESTPQELAFAGGLIGGQGAFANADYNFDPLGLSEKFPDALPWFRESELKHGRIAMLAFVGMVVPDFFTLPFLPERCAKAGTSADALYGRAIEAHDMCAFDPAMNSQTGPLFIVLLGAGAIEIITTVQKVVLGWGLTLENAGEYPGRAEIGGFLDQLPKKKDGMTVIKLQELKHCRLAMLAFSGAITQAAFSGNNFPWVF